MPYTGVYVFGDSLVDSGNVLKLAEFVDDLPFSALPDGAPTAAEGYFMGRFTTGYNFADLISNKFIATPTKPVFPFGYEEPSLGLSLPFLGDPQGNNLNFAYGSAQIRKGDEAVPDLDDQTDAYRDAVDSQADSSALHLLAIGSNDVKELVPSSGPIADMPSALARLTSAADEVQEEIDQLIAIGVDHIVVTGIPDLGIIPRYNGVPNEAERRAAATDYSQLLDEKIQAGVSQLQASNPAVEIRYVSLVEATATIVANLETIYGTDALYPLGQSKLLFFDSVHPPAQVHALLAASILDAMSGAPAGEAIASADPDYSLGGAISAAGETHRIVVSLAADTEYRFEMLGISSGSGLLADPMLRTWAPGGLEIATDDDGGLGLDASLTLRSVEAGDYVITLEGAGSLTGSYKVQASGDAAGDNSYRVSTAGAVILERAGEGNDHVLASVSYALAPGVSIETLATISETDSASIDLSGNEVSQRISGNAGANILIGGAGSDTIYGGEGNDLLDGRSLGVSALDADSGFGGAGADTLYGSESNDHLYGGGLTVTPGDGADVISGFAGGDYIQGNAGADILDGGRGADRIQGGADADAITGGTENDALNGNKGDDTVEGGSGHDVLRGGQGNDLIDGGDGDDLLSGDFGIDSLTGGPGADIFIFAGQASAPSTGPDQISDYVDGADRFSIGYAPVILLTGANQISAGAASIAAQQLFDANPGLAKAAAISVGANTYLFYSSDIGRNADSAFQIMGVDSIAISLDDFV